MAASAVLFGWSIRGKLQRCEIDMQGLDDVPTTSEGAYQIVKLTRKKIKMGGKFFILYWKTKLFLITPIGKDFTTFELSLEFTQGKE